MSRGSGRFGAVSLVVLALVATLGFAPAASAARVVAVSATPSLTTATPADTVSVTGTATASARVVLERYVAGKWGQVSLSSAATTAVDGAYSIVFPTDWYLRHTLRVRDVKTGKVSPTFTVLVHPDYTPEGKAASWTLLMHNGARWNPCKPISWRLNRTGGFKDDVDAIKDAFAIISLATGLRFQYLGTSTKQVGDRRRIGYANILIDWKTPQQDHRLSGSVIGWGRPVPARLKSGKFEIVAGDIVLDASAIEDPADFDNEPSEIEAINRDQFEQIAVHEIGHVVGLNHTEDVKQMMYPVMGAGRLGAGDLAGFKRQGAASGCLAGAIR